MRSLELVRYALSTGVAVISLCSCGGTSMPARTATNTTGEAAPRQRSKTFNYTGKRETFIVPAGVTQLTVVAHGAEGAGTPYYPSSDTPGLPGRIYAIVPVHPGNKLYVFVGGSGAHGGFNGGGSGGSSGKYSGNAGGGASDVRMGGDSVQNRIIVAAGGGGAGVAIYTYGVGYGGDGGGVVGKSGGGGGSHYGGGGGAGGTQSAGGSGGAGGQGYYGGDNGEPGSSGTLGAGGNGGDGAYYDRYSGGGGGGGGGYYGGGGGGGGSTAYYSSRYLSSEGGGGGGGSSYIEPNAIKSRTWSGWKKAKGDGLVVFSWQ